MFYNTSSIHGVANETEAPLQGMKLKTMEDGSTWGRIYWLNITKDATCFANEAQASKYNGSNRFSLMKYVDKFGSSQVEITNLAPEINGTTGFGGGSANSSGEGSHKYSGASFRITGNTNAEVVMESSAATIPLVNGHTYYARVEIKQSTVQGSAEMFLGGNTAGGGVAAPPIITSQAASAANKWTSISGVAVRSFPTGYHKFRLDYNNSGTSGYTMDFDGLVVIDLTQCFGAGKEPSKSWCDTNIPYFRGTMKIDATSLNYRKWEFMMQYPKHNLAYDRVEYLQSSGTQFIDTGLTTNQNTRVRVVASYTGPYSIYGCQGGVTNFTAGGSGGYFYYDGAQGLSKITDMRYDVHTFDQNKNVCYVDGSLYHTYSTASFTSSCNLFLFARNNGSGGINDAGGNVCIYECQVYNNGTLVRDFVPCIDNTNTPCLFDKITKKFYYNKGSGSFTAGKTLEKNIPVEYYNRWTQTDSPNNNTPGGYQRIHTDWTGHAGPLRKYVSGDRIWDCDNGGNGNWFNPVGQLKVWSTGNSIPGADGNAQYENELWVRIDNLNPATKLQIYNNEILANHFYEI